MVIEVYNSLSDSKEIRVVSSGSTIAENIPEIKEWKNYKIICNNSFVNENHLILPTDKIIIRMIPFSTTALIITGIVVGAVSLGAGIWAGVEGYKARKEAEKVQKEIENMNRNAKDEVINLPYLRGSSNTISIGKTQPYFIGQNLFTPYILNGGKNYRGFSTISGTDGKDQFYNVVMECGFNKQNLKKIYCDDITLKTFDSEEVQEGIYNFDSSSVFASEDSFMEVAQDGNPFTTSAFNQKIIEKQYGDVVKQIDTEHPEDHEDLLYTLENNSMGADVCIQFNGLKKYLDDGTPGEKTRTIVPYYSVDYAHLVAQGNPDPMKNATWVPFKFNQNGTLSNTFRRNTLQQLRFNAHVDFNYNDIFQNGEKRYEEPVTIFVFCNDDKPTEGSEYSECSVQWIHSYCFNTKESKSGAFIPDRIIETREARQSTLLGIKIKATKSNEDKLKSIQIITSGIARTYDIDSESWTTTKTPTSNPAAWLLEVLTSSAHKPSQMEDDEIDLESLAEWYKYCQRKRMTVNFVITSGMTKKSVLEMICDCGRGYLYQNIYGKIAIAIDDEKSNAIAVLNEQNMISFSFQKDVKRKPDGIKLSFIDSESDYQQSSVIIMRDGSDPESRSPDSILSSVNVQGKTTYEEVCRFGYYLLKKESLRPYRATAVIGNEGLFFTPLSKVLVQHPVMKIGKGNGEIKSVILNEDESKIIGLELYDEVNLESTSPYSFIVQCVGENSHTDKEIVCRGGSGRTKEVELLIPMDSDSAIIPHKGDVYSYGLETENTVDEMLVTSIEPSDNGYTLTLVNYDERIFDDSEELPVYIPDFSLPRKFTVTNSYVTREDIESARNELNNKVDGIVLGNSPRYDLVFNSTILKKTKDGAYSPSMIVADGRRVQGDESSVPYYGVFHVYLNGETEEYIPETLARAGGYRGSHLELKITDLLKDRNELTQIQVVFNNGADSILIDQETIPVLSNPNAYSVVLDNDYSAFVCDEEGRVGQNEITIRPHVYYGLSEIPFGSEGWEFANAPTKEGFDFRVDFTNGTLTIMTENGAVIEEKGNIAINLFIHSSEDEEIHIGYINSFGEEVYIGYEESGTSHEVGYMRPAESGIFTTYFAFSKLSEIGVLLRQEDDQTSENYGELVLNGSKIKVNSIDADCLKAGSISGDKIKALSISGEKIKSDAITSDKIKAKTITADKIDIESLFAQIVEIGNILRSKGMSLTSTSKGFYFDKDGNSRINNLICDNGTFNGNVNCQKITFFATPGDNILFNASGRQFDSIIKGSVRVSCYNDGSYTATIYKNGTVLFTVAPYTTDIRDVAISPDDHIYQSVLGTKCRLYISIGEENFRFLNFLYHGSF